MSNNEPNFMMLLILPLVTILSSAVWGFFNQNFIPFLTTSAFWIILYGIAIVYAFHQTDKDLKKQQDKKKNMRNEEFKKILEEKGFHFNGGDDDAKKEDAEKGQKNS